MIIAGQPTAMRPLMPAEIHVESADDIPNHNNNLKKVRACVLEDVQEDKQLLMTSEEPEVTQHDPKADLQNYMTQIESFLQEQQLQESQEQKQLYGDPSNPAEVEDEALQNLRISVEIERFIQEFDNVDQTYVQEEERRKASRWKNVFRAMTEDERQLEVCEDEIEKVDTEPAQAQPPSSLRRSKNRQSSRSFRGSRRIKKSNPGRASVLFGQQFEANDLVRVFLVCYLFAVISMVLRAASSVH